jgi:GrpB-like predicted nucleotidyltransferase (UPF0157 family)
MRFFRFDPEVSIPVDRVGSRFRIGPMIAEGSDVRVQMIYLGPGGLVGRHRAGFHQLVAVVAGSGWVCGANSRRRGVATGRAVFWEPGEEHEAGTDEGMTAVCIEGTFELQAVAVTQEIVVADYNPDWPQWFEEVRAHVWPAVANVALRIDHVGSTSVRGMAAKPIIDMDIVVADASEVSSVTDRLVELGYRWRGDLGVTGREAFDVQNPGGLPDHHLYLVVEDNRAHMDHWLLRDLLREDHVARRRYGELKRRNMEIADGDMDIYVSAKAALVAELLTRARHERGLSPETYWVPETSPPS